MHKGLFQWIANKEEEFVTVVCCITEKKVLVIVPVQSILLIPLRVKLQALEYRHRWWSPFIEKQFALGFRT